MKLVTLLFFAITLSLSAFGQNEPTNSLPAIKNLPKEGEVKHMYELPTKTDYEIFNSKGELIAKGNAKFIDYSDYKDGLFFISFNGKTKKFIKE